MRVQAFLSELGRRLRRAREAAGKSLTQTAREARLSRRYLTEAEAGRANPSASVLARLSAVLEMPLAELLDIHIQARTPERVALVGVRGAGKSTVGRLLARELEVPFVELDRRIEELAGLSLAEIFGVHGEALYRRYEREALEQVLAEGGRLVIAVGGSIVTSERTFARLRETCRTVWLRARPADHFARVMDQGDHRPMRNRPRAMEELRNLIEEREPLYARCGIAVETSDRSPEVVVRNLLEEWAREG